MPQRADRHHHAWGRLVFRVVGVSRASVYRAFAASGEGAYDKEQPTLLMIVAPAASSLTSAEPLRRAAAPGRLAAGRAQTARTAWRTTGCRRTSTVTQPLSLCTATVPP